MSHLPVQLFLLMLLPDPKAKFSVFISDLWENIDDGSLPIAPSVVSSANSVSTYMHESFSMSFYQIYLGQILHSRYLALKY